jgi:surface polysaccharide O-acyltransferase-like enzyme
MNNTKLQDISMLRAIAIIIVVAFHIYGMTYQGNHFCQEMKDSYAAIYFIPLNVIGINLAMPLFTFISGYLFQFLLEKGKYATWKNLIFKKTKRIFLPFYVWTVIMMITTNSCNSQALIRGGYWHLWYLPMLFWCFVTGYLLKKWSHNVCASAMILVGFFLLLFFDKFLPLILGLYNLTKWYCWFALGIYCFVWRHIISSALGKYGLNYFLIGIFILVNCFFPTVYGEVSIYGVITQIGAVLGIYSIFHNLSESQISKLRFLYPISRTSFGLYIFHNWIGLYMVSNTAKRILNLQEIGLGHPILFPLMLFLVNLAISYFLTWLLMKNKYGKMLV